MTDRIYIFFSVVLLASGCAGTRSVSGPSNLVRKITIDGFEDGGLTEYAGDRKSFSVQNENARMGSFALKFEGGSARPKRVSSTDGLPQYLRRGSVVELHLKIPRNVDPADVSAGVQFGLAGQDDVRGDFFKAYYSGKQNLLRIASVSGSDETVLGRAKFPSSEVPTGEWTRFVVQWLRNGGLHARWETRDGALLAGACARDQRFADHTGIGILASASGAGDGKLYFDDLRLVRPKDSPDEEASSDLRITRPVDGKTYLTLVRSLEFEAGDNIKKLELDVENAKNRRWKSIRKKSVPVDGALNHLVPGTGRVTYRLTGVRKDGSSVSDTVTFRVACAKNRINLIDPAIWQNNPYRRIHVRSPDDLEATRKTIVKNVYRKRNSLPERTGQVTRNVDEVPTLKLEDLDHWKRVDRVKIESELNTTGYAFYVRSANPKKKALFVHKAGHAGNFTSGGRKAFTQKMLKRGYDVLLVGMYARSFNSADYNHDDLVGKQTDSFNPLKLFHDHVAVGLNYAVQQRSYDHLFMTGKSGGGWSTATYGAMDLRIERIYPIAGTQPIYISDYQEMNGHHSYDYEQGNDPYTYDFYSQHTNFDHYLIATAGPDRGGIFVNVLEDDCCFYGVNNRITEEVMKNVLKTSFSDEDSFRWYIDDSVDSHSISSEVADLILNDAEKHIDKEE